MRTRKRLLILLAVLAGALTSGAALARGYHHHGHFHSGLSLGLVLGGPLWYPAPAYPYPYPYAYTYPPAVVVNPAPRVYVERDDQAIPRQSAPGVWYYCRESNLYYPYARECAGPWERVPATPQNP
jgi:hypothetical protein